MRIPPQQPCPLLHQDVIRIGDVQGNSISLTIHHPGGGAPDRGTMFVDTSLFATVQAITIGRDPQSNLPLQSPQVSRNHARIERTPQGDILVDLNSTNGTWLDGRRIERAYLSPGSQMRAGSSTLTFSPIDEEVTVEP
ncbi:MAG: FHA domain-containing protein, partial [Anaerolineae bacterium]|nr:FHA domain-containing protein [Anaerolineae bacterium]